MAPQILALRLPSSAGKGNGTNHEGDITDLDVEMLNRAEYLSATDKERGSWVEQLPILSGLPHSYEEEEKDLNKLT